MSEEFGGMRNIPAELEQSMQGDWAALQVSHKMLINSRLPCMRLPAEVWMCIFEFASLASAFQVRTNDYLAFLKRFRSVLVSVCISWRLIAKRTRSLWSPLVLKPPVSAMLYDGLTAQIDIAANRPFEIIFDDCSA